MSPQRRRPGRLLYHWLKRIKLVPLGLPWFPFLSILIHIGFLRHFSFISRHEPRPFSLSKIAIVTVEGATSPFQETTENKASPGARAAAPPRDRRVVSPGSASPSASSSGTPAVGESSADGGNIVTDSGGVGVAGQGSATGAVGTNESGSGSGIGNGAAKGKPQPAGKGGPSTAERSVIVIPPSIQRTTSPYESEVYAEVDLYTLFTPDLRLSVNVPANEVCLDGDILRTHERRTVTQRITDISKCRYELQGDDQERMRCSPEAYTIVIAYDNYLSSPVKYDVNVCVAYDKFSSYIAMRDDGPEREICRVRGKYDGIWAAGTMFHYPCSKSSSQTFVHSLQYEVRYLQRVEFPEERMRRRIVAPRETIYLPM